MTEVVFSFAFLVRRLHVRSGRVGDDAGVLESHALSISPLSDQTINADFGELANIFHLAPIRAAIGGVDSCESLLQFERVSRLHNGSDIAHNDAAALRHHRAQSKQANFVSAL